MIPIVEFGLTICLWFIRRLWQERLRLDWICGSAKGSSEWAPRVEWGFDAGHIDDMACLGTTFNYNLGRNHSRALRHPETTLLIFQLSAVMDEAFERMICRSKYFMRLVEEGSKDGRVRLFGRLRNRHRIWYVFDYAAHDSWCCRMVHRR